MTQPTEYQEHPTQPAPLPPEPAQQGAPPQAPQIVMQRPPGKSDAQLLAEARAALRGGANPAAVEAQLKAYGVNIDGR